LAATLWVARTILDRGVPELDQVSQTLEFTARQFYQREKESLQRTASPERLPLLERRLWPSEVEEFWESGERERFVLLGKNGDTLAYFVRRENGVLRATRTLSGVPLNTIRKQIAQARSAVEDVQSRRLFYAFLVLAVVPWLAALAILVFSVHRISTVAMRAYNRMAEELQQSRERLLYLTRLESWQALARKTAHEVKNSLTPIRLIMEELAARHSAGENSFERQAAQIIVDEVNSLERRVRAFSEFASEPPVTIEPLDANALLEERISFLKSAHPEVTYRLALHERAAEVLADQDLLKAVLTNLLENAAEAAGPKGTVLARTAAGEGRFSIEVHDSGPGLHPQSIETLFEPAISFKKGGMGLGLSIARKSALLLGGDIVLVKGELGGAGFRVELACPRNAS
jgi:signal transduction histidine kinase